MSKLVTSWITSKVTEPGSVQAAKKVYQVDRTGMPGGTSTTDQADHAPAVDPDKEQVPAEWDSEKRAQMLLAYAEQIQREKPGRDFWTAWLIASAEHPDLIGSSDGMSKDIEVPSTNVVAGTNKLPDSGENAVTASYKDIGAVRFR